MADKVIDLAVALGAFFSKNKDQDPASLLEGGKTNVSIFEAEPGEWRLLQPVWDLRIGYEDYVGSPMFPVVLNVSFYLLLVSPFSIIDLFLKDWPIFKKHKILPDEEVTWPQVKNAIALTAWNHVLYLLPISFAQWVWQPVLPLPKLAPNLFEFVWQQFVALVLFDLFYFVWHWYHHKNRWLYRHVHSVHHQYYVCSSWVTQYLHPWELISVGFMTTILPLYFQFHPLTNFSFMMMNVYVSTEDHIGYDFPFMPHHWAPFWGGSVKHDMHHQKPLTNFQPHFNTFDRLFGFYCPGILAGGVKPKELLEWEKRQKEKRAAKRAAQQHMKDLMDAAAQEVAAKKTVKQD